LRRIEAESPDAGGQGFARTGSKGLQRKAGVFTPKNTHAPSSPEKGKKLPLFILHLNLN